MKHTKAKCILFIDLDNTLLSNAFEIAIFPLVAAHISEETGADRDSIKMLLVEEHKHRLESPKSPIEVYDWDDIVRTVAKKLGGSFDIPIENLVKRFASKPYISLHGQVDSVLMRIKKPHRMMVAATNGLSRYQIPVLKALDIYKHFDQLLTPDLTQSLKGNKEFYDEFLNETVMAISIGDNYRADIVGPKNLGMYAVWIDDSMESDVENRDPFARVHLYDSLKDYDVLPDAIIQNLEELPGVIDKIELMHKN